VDCCRVIPGLWRFLSIVRSRIYIVENFISASVGVPVLAQQLLHLGHGLFPVSLLQWHIVFRLFAFWRLAFLLFSVEDRLVCAGAVEIPYGHLLVRMVA
jgi:hypothetical protein